jgi:hypothetical protein
MLNEFELMLQPSRFRRSFASSARITADIEGMPKALALGLSGARMLICSG